MTKGRLVCPALSPGCTGPAVNVATAASTAGKFSRASLGYFGFGGANVFSDHHVSLLGARPSAAASMDEVPVYRLTEKERACVKSTCRRIHILRAAWQRPMIATRVRHARERAICAPDSRRSLESGRRSGSRRTRGRSGRTPCNTESSGWPSRRLRPSASTTCAPASPTGVWRRAPPIRCGANPARTPQAPTPWTRPSGRPRTPARSGSPFASLSRR
eukprot:1774350-Prymnesium_polylepis.2